MSNFISILFGLIALVLALPQQIPFFGWIGWLILPIIAVGLLFGFISPRNSGRNFCLIVLAIVVLRLFLGGGFI